MAATLNWKVWRISCIICCFSKSWKQKTNMLKSISNTTFSSLQSLTTSGKLSHPSLIIPADVSPTKKNWNLSDQNIRKVTLELICSITTHALVKQQYISFLKCHVSQMVNNNFYWPEYVMFGAWLSQYFHVSWLEWVYGGLQGHLRPLKYV